MPQSRAAIAALLAAREQDKKLAKPDPIKPADMPATPKFAKLKLKLTK